MAAADDLRTAVARPLAPAVRPWTRKALTTAGMTMAANAVAHSNGSEPIRFVTREEPRSTTTMTADNGSRCRS